MGKNLFIAAVIFFGSFFSGCASGLIGTLPPIDNTENAADIYIIRGHSFMGSGVSAYVFLDNAYILAIKIDEYTRFLAPPGDHMIGVKFRGNPASRIPISLAPGKKYFYGIKVGFGSVTLWPMKEEEAIPYLNKNSYLSIDNTLKPYYERNNVKTKTKIGKVGIYFERDCVIHTIRKNSPAMSAGMEVGDRIISVNDKVENSYNYFSKNIKGEPGTTVKITVLRDDKKIDFILERQILDGEIVE